MLARHVRNLIAKYPQTLGLAGGFVIGVVVIVAAFFVGQAVAQPAAPNPNTLVARARIACPAGDTTKCRTALVHALRAIAWQRGENLKLAREMVGNVAAWSCIHNGRKPSGARVGSGEGPWNANTGNGYFGGLQMDVNFMRTYGRDMIARHHGGLAHTWTPREQLIVAQRAFSQNRGYNPWPNTARACGLLS